MLYVGFRGKVVTGERGSDYARFSTVRSIAAAADRFGGRPSAFGRMPPTGGVGVRARFLEDARDPRSPLHHTSAPPNAVAAAPTLSLQR